MLQRLIDERPQFHTGWNGNPTSWGVHPDTLRFLHDLLEPGMPTLETGAGHTTVVFGIARTHHVCVTPRREEVTLITDYLERLEIDWDVTFLEGSSDLALAGAPALPEELGLVFLDGQHTFPYPVIDWHFTEARLRPGGIMAVDDYKMPSVRVLTDFLRTEAEWEELRVVRNTAFFRKLREPRYRGDWMSQRINRRYRSIQRHKATLRRWRDRLLSRSV